MEPRDAATVMLVRDGSSGLEVLMLQRRLDSAFVPGAHVFPGGALDPSDHHDEVSALCEGLSQAAAARLLGVHDRALAFWVAAVRETFEEAGVLLAYDHNGTVVRLDDPDLHGRFAQHRREVDRGSRRLAEVCRAEGLRLAVDRMRYFGRWITPPGPPRRYDTRFFVAPAPEAQTPSPDEGETISDLWIRPCEALERSERGRLELIIPTVRSLVALDRFATASGLFDALDGAQSGNGSDGPTMVADSGGERVALPGDREALGPSGELPATARPVTPRPGAILRDLRCAGLHVRRGDAVTDPEVVEGPRPEELAPGVARALSPLVRRIVAPNPGFMTGPGTNTYLVGIDEIVVVDPGPDDASHLDAIAGCGGDRIRWIVPTHTHFDHSTGAEGLKKRTGAEILGFEARGALVPDRLLADGDTIEATEFRLRAVHTPGHASGHLCFHLPEEQTLFSGDHINNGQTVVINPPDGDMAVYMDSLHRVEKMRLKMIAPGHGHAITDPRAKIDEYLSHRVERERQLLSALTEAGTATVDQLVEIVYADTIIEQLRPVAARTVYAHLLKLKAEKKVKGRDENGTWRPA